ncbi:MAG TPA: efflux RND transporter periplasmic adaptor subunit [Tepidisphaeraceae bacterium]|jgi:RND family efflux transporter MFP subunit|nr:efflux RND transporter periplasmic adaptor subunit [Tepidisphaeraceae bacterium]
MTVDWGHRLPSPPGLDPDSPLPALPAPPQKEEKKDEPPAPPPARTRTIAWIVAGIAVAFIVILALGMLVRVHNRRRLAAAASKAVNTPPQVNVIHAVQPPEGDLVLAAYAQPMQDAVLYARTSGYLSKRYVDLGDHVKAGQVLAEIESPEIDQQLEQARADLRQSYKNVELQKANLEFARVTVERYKAADKELAVAKEDVDQRISAYQTAQASVAAAEANVGSNQANVRRLEAMTSFERIVAPFDGDVTQRSTDVGALVTSGSPTNNTTAAPTSVNGGANGLFEVAQVDTLRVFVNVPQAYASNIKVGLPVKVSVRGQLMDPAPALVTRTASALDPGTRTLLTEVDIPNKTHKLLSGMFVTVSFQLAPAGTRWRVPDTAVIFDQRGTQVMIVRPDHKLHLTKVVLGRDFGNAIDLQAGVDGSELIVKQPTVSQQEGQVVTPVESKMPPAG